MAFVLKYYYIIGPCNFKIYRFFIGRAGRANGGVERHLVGCCTERCELRTRLSKNRALTAPRLLKVTHSDGFEIFEIQTCQISFDKHANTLEPYVFVVE